MDFGNEVQLEPSWKLNRLALKPGGGMGGQKKHFESVPLKCSGARGGFGFSLQINLSGMARTA